MYLLSSKTCHFQLVLGPALAAYKAKMTLLQRFLSFVAVLVRLFSSLCLLLKELYLRICSTRLVFSSYDHLLLSKCVARMPRFRSRKLVRYLQFVTIRLYPD